MQNQQRKADSGREESTDNAWSLQSLATCARSAAPPPSSDTTACADHPPSFSRCIKLNNSESNGEKERVLLLAKLLEEHVSVQNPLTIAQNMVEQFEIATPDPLSAARACVAASAINQIEDCNSDRYDQRGGSNSASTRKRITECRPELKEGKARVSSTPPIRNRRRQTTEDVKEVSLKPPSRFPINDLRCDNEDVISVLTPPNVCTAEVDSRYHGSMCGTGEAPSRRTICGPSIRDHNRPAKESSLPKFVETMKETKSLTQSLSRSNMEKLSTTSKEPSDRAPPPEGDPSAALQSQTDEEPVSVASTAPETSATSSEICLTPRDGEAPEDSESGLQTDCSVQNDTVSADAAIAWQLQLEVMREEAQRVANRNRSNHFRFNAAARLPFVPDSDAARSSNLNAGNVDKKKFMKALFRFGTRGDRNIVRKDAPACKESCKATDSSTTGIASTRTKVKKSPTAGITSTRTDEAKSQPLPIAEGIMTSFGNPDPPDGAAPPNKDEIKRKSRPSVEDIMTELGKKNPYPPHFFTFKCVDPPQPSPTCWNSC